MRLVALIEDAAIARRILLHAGIAPRAPPVRRLKPAPDAPFVSDIDPPSAFS